MLVTKETVEHYLGHRVQNINSSTIRDVASAGIPSMARVGAWLNKGVATAVSVVEDLPYPSNRITTQANGRATVHDQKPAELLNRTSVLKRELVKRTRNSISINWLTQGELNPAHMCGTLRFGTDARRSVLDATNRVHDLENLYVVDSSFFPTSGGINPSLTIAANALRVAGIMDQRM